MQKCLYQLDLLLKQQTAPSDTAAILVEPVLGEGGYIPAPASFLKGLREVCDKNNILLIIDEVQCGFGRTGTNFCIENSGVKPDIMIVAKVRIIFVFQTEYTTDSLVIQGLANGFPLSAVISRTELTDKLKGGTLVCIYRSDLSCLLMLNFTGWHLRRQCGVLCSCHRSHRGLQGGEDPGQCQRTVCPFQACI